MYIFLYKEPYSEDCYISFRASCEIGIIITDSKKFLSNDNFYYRPSSKRNCNLFCNVYSLIYDMIYDRIVQIKDE
jgi:hypothetical protein